MKSRSNRKFFDNGYLKRDIVDYSFQAYFKYAKGKRGFTGKQSLYSDILSSIMSKIRDRIIHEGFRWKIPSIGSFLLVRRKVPVYFTEDGKVDVDRMPIDWAETRRLKKLGIDKKVPVDYEPTFGHQFRIMFLKRTKYKNMKFYIFKPRKDLTPYVYDEIKKMDKIPESFEMKYIGRSNMIIK